jgi:hypothetical protein
VASASPGRKGGNRHGDWIDPDAGRIPFGTYADTWINDHVLKPRTDELYRSLLKNHLKPFELPKVLASRQGSGSSPRELANQGPEQARNDESG